MKARSVLITVAVLTATLSVSVLAQERRTIPVTVVDKDGKIVEGLTAANFRAKIHGKRIEVLTAEFNKGPKHIAIFLDASPSMHTGRRWKMALEILRALTERLPPQDILELTVFATAYETIVAPTGDRGAILAALCSLPPPDSRAAKTAWGKKTEVEVALRDWLREKENSRLDVVLLVTDGPFDTRSSSLRGARNLFMKRSTRLIMLLVRKHVGAFRPMRIDSTTGALRMPPLSLERSLKTSHLSRAARETGGATILLTMPPNHLRLAPTEKIAGEITERIGLVYSLRVAPGRSVDQRRKWKLEVVDENGKKMKGVQVHYPRYLVPLESGQ